ncbi:MAG: MBL fold metallo-hydrolase [Cellulosilyticum sp.]|nr:MBL fold metallo-hydrolase [Cellulosilyticum sp.]
MKAYIAGGCYEHGRNSFLLEGSEYSLLVDCGTMQGSDTPNPYLSKEQISKIRYVFLTHSHKDHVGSLEWLYQQGFCGKVYLAKETYEQMPVKPREYVLLDISKLNTVRIENDLEVSYGRSGHCVGSLWFKMSFDKKEILFTGDYCEDSEAYICDVLRDTNVDMAFVDCAYGNKIGMALQSKEKLNEKINEYFNNGQHLLLPVPPNGRGFDMLKMVSSSGYGKNIVVDSVLKERIDASPLWKEWLKENSIFQDIQEMSENSFDDPTVIIMADAQMKSKQNQMFAQEIIKQEGKILFTGHTDLNSYASKLVKSGQAELLIYSVHQNLEEALILCEKNQWQKVILTHCSKELPIEDGSKFLKVKSKDKILF